MRWFEQGMLVSSRCMQRDYNLLAVIAVGGLSGRGLLPKCYGGVASASTEMFGDPTCF